MNSPNHSRRGQPVTGTVIHYTAGGPWKRSARWLCHPRAGASAHYIIGRRGQTRQLVPLSRAAWHAGRSEMFGSGEMRSGANQFTIGIELANSGLLVFDKGRFWYRYGNKLTPYKGAKPIWAVLKYDSGLRISGYWEPYPREQIVELQGVLNSIRLAGYETAADNLIGHEEIAMPLGHKKDPGPLFPWPEFKRILPKRTVGEL